MFKNNQYVWNILTLKTVVFGKTEHIYASPVKLIFYGLPLFTTGRCEKAYCVSIQTFEFGKELCCNKNI
jgi:hypothetical protein